MWKSWIILGAIAILGGPGADARSPRPPPVRRVHTPRSSLSILPRTHKNPLARARSFNAPPPPPSELLHSDTIHLTITLPDTHEEAHLLLRPSENIIHPNAFVRVDGKLDTRLREEDYRLYRGEVVHPTWINRAKGEEVAGMRGEGNVDGVVGTATAMVHHTGINGVDPLWGGSFTIHGTTYHVKPTKDYERYRTAKDAVVEEQGRMVVFRDIDMYEGDDPEDSDKAHVESGSPIHSCGHDGLEHNANTSHPIWQNRHKGMFTPIDSWEDYLGLGFFGLGSASSHLGARHRASVYEPVPGSVFGKRSDTPTGGSASGPGSNYLNSINSTQGCPSTQQVVYMGFALDCNYVQGRDSAQEAREHILEVMNQVSDLYRRTFNVSLGIIELEVEDATCPTSTPSDKTWNVGCGSNLSLDERLSRFSQWRGNKGDDGAGLWHLMSACATDREVGVAWLGTVCQTSAQRQGSSYVSGTGVSTALQTEWPLIAHEIGHGFGAIHDCTSGCSLSDSCCPYSQSTCSANGRFIMNPTTNSVETQFSGCTLGNVCTNIGSRLVQTGCFESPGQRSTIALEQCGNGIVDPGEECDAGFNSTSPCCDPETCKFRSGAVCDPSNSACCTDQCSFASSGTVCRPAVDGRCDYAETCTGNSSSCPEDQHKPDGDSCGDSGQGLSCAAGRCTSLDQQCQQSSGSMNLTTACGQKHDTSCVISCRDPRSSNQCIVMQTPLLDGSECGWAGRCYNQTCQEGSWQAQFSSMYRQNLQISIPVTIVVGILVLAILYFILRRLFACCSGGRNRSKSRKGRPVPPGGAYPPPPMRQTNGGHSNAYRQSHMPPPPGGGGPNTGAGAGAGAYPYPPPPEMGRHSGSVNSQDPILDGNGQGQHNWAYSNGNGPQQPPNAYNAHGGRQAWVDESMYNGPNYGANQAWGR